MPPLEGGACGALAPLDCASCLAGFAPYCSRSSPKCTVPPAFNPTGPLCAFHSRTMIAAKPLFKAALVLLFLPQAEPSNPCRAAAAAPAVMRCCSAASALWLQRPWVMHVAHTASCFPALAARSAAKSAGVSCFQPGRLAPAAPSLAACSRWSPCPPTLPKLN